MTLHNNYEHIHGESCVCNNCHNMRMKYGKITKYDLLKHMQEECLKSDINILIEAFDRLWSTYGLSDRKVLLEHSDWIEDNLFS